MTSSSALPHVLTADQEVTYVDSRLSNDERSLRKAAKKTTELLAALASQTTSTNGEGSISSSSKPITPDEVWTVYKQELRTVSYLVRKAAIVARMEESMREEYEQQKKELGSSQSCPSSRVPRLQLMRGLIR
jgi:hypothetical protein